jgi:hypothetical protein
MTPTGFGSVACEQIEFLLDGQRLDLMDWNGGGRAPASDCGGRIEPEGRAGQAGPEAFFGGRGGRAMRVRFKTTAGSHMVGATFLATQYAPLLDLDRRFMRSTIQTGPTPGYTFFPHVGTIRIEGPFDATPAADSPSRRRIFVCTPGSASDEAACARRIVTSLATRAFRGPVASADVDALMEFYEYGRRECTGGGAACTFDRGIEAAVARILASPQFIYRIVEEPAAQRAAAQPFRIDDIDLASRLSFFLWSTIPDEALIEAAQQGRLSTPAGLEQEVRRMLRHPKARALAANFAGQWLNLRGLESSAPLPLLYPDFDDPLRQAMRTEVEMLFDTIVREDRSILELLTADYTFVNERLARHYGIPHVYGSQFRRVELGAGLEARRGLLGKGAFLVTTSKPERTSPVTRGKWIMTNVLGMSPPDPPADVPPLPAREADARGTVREPTMRETMIDHRVRADCVQCHRMMDPIGFALETFDAIGLWRSHESGEPVNTADRLYDNTPIDGPVELQRWLVGYSDTFVRVAVEKLLTYALGRGLEYQDMPLVRAIARDVAREDHRFSALVMSVVNSPPFHMSTPEPQAASVQDIASRSTSERGSQ